MRFSPTVHRLTARRFVEVLDPRGEVAPVGGLVGEVAAAHHLQGVMVSRGCQLEVETKLLEPVLEPDEVKLGQYGGLESVLGGNPRGIRAKCHAGQESGGNNGNGEKCAQTGGNYPTAFPLLKHLKPFFRPFPRTSSPAVFEPVEHEHLDRPGYRNRAERAQHASERRADQHGDEHDQRRELHGSPVHERLQKVVLDLLVDDEEDRA